MLGYAMALKGLADLAAKLEASTTDRKILNALFPLKQGITNAEIEHLNAEREHDDEIKRLKAENVQEIANLEEKIRALESQILEMQTSHQGEVLRLQAEHSTLVASLTEQISKQHQFTISNEHELVLIDLAAHADGCTADEIASRTGLHLRVVEFRLGELRDNGYAKCTAGRLKIHPGNVTRKQPDTWQIAEPGMAELIATKKLPDKVVHRDDEPRDVPSVVTHAPAFHNPRFPNRGF